MKKFLFSVMPFLMMAMCVFTFSACSDDDDDSGSNGSAIVGTWVERFDYSSYVGVTTFNFNADGTGVKSYRQEYSDNPGLTQDPVSFYYTYNGETGAITLKFENDGTLYSGTASITGKTLVLKYGGTYYTLSKQ